MACIFIFHCVTVQAENWFFGCAKIIPRLIWHYQSKWIEILYYIVDISISTPVSAGAKNIIEINYSTFFLNFVRQSIATEYSSKMFDSKFFNPINQIKIRQWFNYKMEPKIRIELNGLSFPSSIPFPFFVFFFLAGGFWGEALPPPIPIIGVSGHIP